MRTVDGKAGFLVVLPDKSEVKLRAMQMMEGFGGDVDLVAEGDYKITTKIALGSTTLVDEFVYTIKPAAAATAALVNATCPISGGVVSRLTGSASRSRFQTFIEPARSHHRSQFTCPGDELLFGTP